MTQTQPERVTTGMLCGYRLGQQTQYPCTRAQNHEKENYGEPHYAVEVAPSVRAWQTWRKQRDAQEVYDAQPPLLVSPHFSCTVEPHGALVLNAEGTAATCDRCGESIVVQYGDGPEPGLTVAAGTSQTASDPGQEASRVLSASQRPVQDVSVPVLAEPDKPEQPSGTVATPPETEWRHYTLSTGQVVAVRVDGDAILVKAAHGVVIVPLTAQTIRIEPREPMS